MLDFNTAPNLVLKAVKQFPYHQTRQPNCFAVIQELDELTDENFKKLAVHHDSNEFWARDWAARGANPSELNREYPAVFVRSMEVVTEGEKVGVLRDFVKYAVGIVDLTHCQNCKKRTIEQVKADLLVVLKAIRSEIRRQQQYNVILNSAELKVWATEEEMTLNQSSFMSFHKLNKVFNQYTKNWSDIGFFSLPIDNAVAAQMTFLVNVCTSEIVFNYAFSDAEKLAFVKCETCP